MARTVRTLTALLLAAAGGPAPGLMAAQPADAAASTTPAPPARVVRPGEPFPLRPGEVADLVDGALRVGFDGVGADSRCPKGEMCVWAGDASVQVWVLAPGSEPRRGVLHTAPGRDSALQAGDHVLQLLALHPEPVSGRAIAPGAYVATLRLDRADTRPSPESGSTGVPSSLR